MSYVLFTLPTCYRCPAVKAMLESSGVPGEVRDASKHVEYCREMNIRSVPTVLFFEGEHLVDRAYDINGVKSILKL